MNIRIKIVLFSTILLFSCINVISQNTHEIKLLITDSVVIRKKVKKSYKHAIKVNAEISVNGLQDSVVLYFFNKYDSSDFFGPSDFKRFTTGLLYIIENINGNIMSANFQFISYKNSKIEEKILNSRILVSSKLRIKGKLLDEKEQLDYDMAKNVIYNKKQRLELFPVLGKYHSYNLPKGEYYIYFVYSCYPDRLQSYGLPNDESTFIGYFVSNKVKLIIE
jgi:hypothetical protein